MGAIRYNPGSMGSVAFSTGMATKPGSNGRKMVGTGSNLCSLHVSGTQIARVTTMAASTPAKEIVFKEKVAVKKQRQTKQPDMYRIFIYNDPFNRRERVIDVLLKTCQGLSFSRAYSAMQEAHEHGRGLVVVVAQEIAEHYCVTINSGTLHLKKLFIVC